MVRHGEAADKGVDDPRRIAGLLGCEFQQQRNHKGHKGHEGKQQEKRQRQSDLECERRRLFHHLLPSVSFVPFVVQVVSSSFRCDTKSPCGLVVGA
jgi:hypothetical protein